MHIFGKIDIILNNIKLAKMNKIKSFLNYKGSQKQKISVSPNPLVEFASSWRIAWGKIDAIADDAAWRENQLAIICSNPNVQVVVSPSDKFVMAIFG